MEIWPGKPYPLGAMYDGFGTNFSIFSEAAHRVELCLFDDSNRETRLDLPEITAYCWHTYLPGTGPGQRYGFRVHGPWDPASGSRCNPAKLLLDPYAKAIEGQVRWNPAMFPYRFGGENDQVETTDSASFAPRSVVVNPYFDWAQDRPIRRPLHETVIYEVHVKGFTIRHPDIPATLRGTYTALTHPSVLDHLKDLGITAIELMPIHQFIHDEYLIKKDLRNYWGYNSIGYFAPHNEYSGTGESGQQVQEFKQMVKVLHNEGIEVILDVVYNHTAEGNHLGPMLCFKGIDNVAYYRLEENDRHYYTDYTGTGNSLNVAHPHVLQLIMDSLRYWVLDMHVDGFRFDLASALARQLHDVDRLSAFFDLIQQDPVVGQVKLIAEPWDVGVGGYQVGNFPPQWSEWNGKYRDCIRDFWRGQDQTLGEFAYRFTGSSDLYEYTSRRPFASINFVTAHDGFTLNDLVSYNEKHNEANLDENRDGESNNRSWNCNTEGPTDDPDIIDLRCRQKRNFLATLMLSQGVPMLLGGDEIGRTQRGNNNAYCQDNEISWFDWESTDTCLLEFVKELIALKREHPVFRRKRWFQGRSIRGTQEHDICWFTPDGRKMEDENWNEHFARSIGIFLNGNEIAGKDERGNRIIDNSFYLLINAHHEPIVFTIPPTLLGEAWATVFDTAIEAFPNDRPLHAPQEEIRVQGRSMVLFQRMA
ncbi:MAG: glycogen debranching protein GlgX [Desulfomonilia bacterium]|nr:glycogen debranching protein GlgX [Deltaproteobacteria bacterium]MDX9761526.1 glycogen debranching protein GlgX [Desulfomonilia bacterium]HPW68399.1 glycogen debranching protein GlgX [Deltaproteobacteria bacterium]